MDQDVIVVFVGNALALGATLERATAHAWEVGARSVERLKYAIPVTHRATATGELVAEPLGVFDIVGYHPTEEGRFGFDLMPSDRDVVVDLPRMYRPFVYRSSAEVFSGMSFYASGPTRTTARRQAQRRPSARRHSPVAVCSTHHIALPAAGRCDDCG